LRILVADDNPDVTTSLATLLTVWGHEVRVAYDGAAALELALASDFDVAILDIGMPLLDGWQLAARLRREPALKEAVLIAASGYSTAADQKRSRESGFDHHLAKPCDLGRLKALLEARGRGQAPGPAGGTSRAEP
jgi:CheY-like chemotaxis protein